MIAKLLGSHIVRRLLLGGVAVTALCFLAGPAMSAQGIDPEADKILKSMSTYLGSLPAFTMSADIDNEIVDLEGQKLQFSSAAAITIQRPGKLHIHRQGVYAEIEILFDGDALTLNGKGKNIYMQVKSPGNIDHAIRTVESRPDSMHPALTFCWKTHMLILAKASPAGPISGPLMCTGSNAITWPSVHPRLTGSYGCRPARPHCQ